MIRITSSVFLMLICQFGVSMQTCPECACCDGGQHFCDSNKNCLLGCQAGYYGKKCTEQCLGNCRICAIGNQCTECKPGYFTDTCNNKCGKGCVNNTCSSISGECTCRSSHFAEGKCDKCSDDKYGDECNITCPSYCGICKDTHCTWCINTERYGTFCQYKCSTGCNEGICNKGDGHCMRGCKLGYIGEKCDSCLPGLYNYTCDLMCTENCYTCISKTNCTHCKSGFYGETCTKTCPSGCNGNCSLSDGRCIVCKPGLFGEFCNSTCRDGTYGVNCSKLCQDVDNDCQECNTGENGIYVGCKKCNDAYYPVTPVGYNYNICKICPHNCIDNKCNTTGSCKDGCVRGKWGDECNIDCKTNCVECNQKDGKCSECTEDTFSEDCLQNCSKTCNTTENDRICAQDTGTCLNGCKSIKNYGKQCEKQCSITCNNQSCDWEKGNCLEGCVMNYYGSFCDNKCADTCKSIDSKRICDGINGHCTFGCTDGFHGNKCDDTCSSQCVNVTCNQITAECLHGCIDGYEGPKCEQAIKGTESEEKKSLAVIAASAGAGVAVIALLVILVICLIKQNRRQKLFAHTKCKENDDVIDMKEISKQTDEGEPGVIYARPFKPKQKAGGDAGKEYDTAYDDDKKIPAIDNGYSAVNLGTSANEKNKSFEVCDIAPGNKCKNPLGGNSDYAVVNKGKSTMKENEFFEEVYDTTHDNKKNKQPLHSNNDYAVLSVRSNNTEGFGKSKLTQPDDVYDFAEGGKHKTMPRPSNDYAVFNSNNGDKHGNDKANTLYDTATDKKMRPGNNDYDFCELDND